MDFAQFRIVMNIIASLGRASWQEESRYNRILSRGDKERVSRVRSVNLTWATQNRSDPVEAFHDCWGDPWPYLPRLTSLTKGKVARLILSRASQRSAKSFFGEAGADSTGEKKPGQDMTLRTHIGPPSPTAPALFTTQSSMPKCSTAKFISDSISDRLN
jgi:hypothetical protein